MRAFTLLLTWAVLAPGLLTAGACTDEGAATDPVFSKVQIIPGNRSISEGETVQFTAVAIFDDLSSADVTADATWGSTDMAVAEVAAFTGVATGVTKGTCDVTVEYQGQSSSTQLKVTSRLTDIEIAPVPAATALGTNVQFFATGIFRDLTKRDLTAEVDWSSTDTGIAKEVANDGADPGRFLGSVAGEVIVNASLGSLAALSNQLTVKDVGLVSLAIAPDVVEIPVGETVQFTVTGTFEDGSEQDLTREVEWTTPADNESAAVGANNGLLNPAAAGETTVTATGFVGPGDDTVTDAIDIQVRAAVLESLKVVGDTTIPLAGTSIPVTAEATYTSDDGDIIVPNSSIASLTVTPPGIVLLRDGLLTPINTGQVTVKATATVEVDDKEREITNELEFTVVDMEISEVAIDIEPMNDTTLTEVGATASLKATGKFGADLSQDLTTAVVWESSDPGIVAIANAGPGVGRATVIALPSESQDITITAHYGEAEKGEFSLTVEAAP